MRISALNNALVLDSAGRRLGRVHEVHASDGRVTKLVYGPAGLIERLTGRVEPVAIPWSDVADVTATRIVLK